MGTNSFVNLPTAGIGYASTVIAASPSDLSSITTIGPLTEGGYQSGQLAFVTSGGPNEAAASYVLQPASGHADGTYVIATADDESRQWVLQSISSGVIYVDSISSGGTTLPSVDCSRRIAGAVAYVGTLKSNFTLTLSSQPPAANYRIPALNKPGYIWIRDVFSPAWWSQPNWDIDPVNGNDENSGIANSNSPLKTFQEINWRLKYRYLPSGESAAVTINLLNDAPDTDGLEIESSSLVTATSASTPSYSLYGKLTVLASGTISAYVPRTPTANLGNQITVPGIDWSQHVGRLIRLQGTSGQTATLASVEKDLGSGQCRLGQQALGTSGNVGVDFSTGQTIEILGLTKVGSISAGTTYGSIIVNYCKFDSATGTRITATGFIGNVVMFGCELRGKSSGVVITPQMSLIACSVVGKPYTFTGSSLGTCVSFINSIGNMFQGTSIRERAHWASCGTQASSITVMGNTYFRAHDDWHAFDQPVQTANFLVEVMSLLWFANHFYGNGNDPGSAGIQLYYGLCTALYSTAPSMDAGLGLYLAGSSVGSGGTSVPWSSLPYALDNHMNAMILTAPS